MSRHGCRPLNTHTAARRVQVLTWWSSQGATPLAYRSPAHDWQHSHAMAGWYAGGDVCAGNLCVCAKPQRGNRRRTTPNGKPRARAGGQRAYRRRKPFCIPEGCASWARCIGFAPCICAVNISLVFFLNVRQRKIENDRKQVSRMLESNLENERNSMKTYRKLRN